MPLAHRPERNCILGLTDGILPERDLPLAPRLERPARGGRGLRRAGWVALRGPDRDTPSPQSVPIRKTRLSSIAPVSRRRQSHAADGGDESGDGTPAGGAWGKPGRWDYRSPAGAGCASDGGRGEARRGCGEARRWIRLPRQGRKTQKRDGQPRAAFSRKRVNPGSDALLPTPPTRAGNALPLRARTGQGRHSPGTTPIAGCISPPYSGRPLSEKGGLIILCGGSLSNPCRRRCRGLPCWRRRAANC